MTEVSANDLGGRNGAEIQVHVPGSTAQVQHNCTRIIESRPDFLKQRFSPTSIDVKREEMIQQVVSRRDTGEHTFHPL
jgi:hypothetical protein